MEPETSAPRPSQEVGSLSKAAENTPVYQNAERHAGVRSAEVSPRHETKEALPAPAAGPSGDPAYVAASISTSLPTQAASPVAYPAPRPIDDNPIMAADEDLIEKEWVEKAKKIIASTKQDPYLQEQEVSRLQADYLKKRYGKELKLPTE